MGLQDQVVFHRDIPQEQVFALMAESDLLLLPSVEEGIANVVLEAMAIGLPVLSSDCGGMPEAIEEGGTGLLFRNRDANHLAEQMIRFMKMSPEEKQTMTTSAQKNVQEKFGLDRLGSEMISLYGEVIANRHAS
jgi:colanic acid/amylovoran biosynthesis glycosyltransferase